MMKAILWGFWPMLLLLVIGAAPENGNANPVDPSSDYPVIARKRAVDARIRENGIVKGMTTIADSLSQVVNKIVAGIQYTHYDTIIKELEKEVGNLPEDLSGDRKNMLNMLYRANSRIVNTKSELEQAARTLKQYVEELLGIYRDHEPNMRTLNYTAKKFNEYAGFVKNQLVEALKTYKDTQNELDAAKASLQNFNYKLKNRKNELTGQGRKKRAVGAIIGGVGIGLAAALGTTLSVVAALSPKDYDELVGRIETVQSKLNRLLNENELITQFVSKEIDLINEWKSKLEVAVNDNHGNLSEDDIFFSIKYIKERLVALRDVCVKYLEHVLPDVLQAKGTKRRLVY